MNRFDRKRETFKHYTHNPNDTSSLSRNGIFALYQDASGSLWVGTNGAGLNKFNYQNETLTRYVHDSQHPKSLSHDLVWVIHQDQSGTLWIGTADGLNRFAPETETFTHYKHDRRNPTSLSDNNISAIYEDGAGVLWIGTYGGLNRFDPKTETFEHFTERDGLVNLFGSSEMFIATANMLDKNCEIDNSSIPIGYLTSAKTSCTVFCATTSWTSDTTFRAGNVRSDRATGVTDTGLTYQKSLYSISST